MACKLRTPEGKGRGRRVKKLSEKAQRIQEDGQELPGIFSSPLSPSEMVLKSQAPKTVEEAVDVLTQFQRVMREPRAAPKCIQGLGTRLLPTFSPDTFQIYCWPHPKPDFLPKVTAAQRAWKDNVDAAGLDFAEFDDGADDWNAFAGNREYYQGKYGLEFAVANSFKNRAFRAYRAGSSWASFEKSERGEDSQAAARAEPDPVRCKLLLEEALDNDLRLAVFNQLKIRLRNEIWLSKDDSMVRGRDSKMVSRQTSGGGDSSDILDERETSKLRNLTIHDASI